MCKWLGFGSVGKIGSIVAVITWFILIIYMATQADCVKTSSCGADDMVLFGVISLGMLPASCFVASLFGGGSGIDD